MATPHFWIGQEVHIAQNHCHLCRKLESELQHPISVQAIQEYDHRGFAYRIVDARNAHYEMREACLCSTHGGHVSNPCTYCGQPSD